MEINLDKIKQYPLSDDDIEKILGKNIFIFTYPFLNRDVKHIDEIFDDMGRSICLYLTTDENSGHWVCMHKSKSNEIHYFDPYGKPVDYAIKNWLSEEQRDDLDMEKKRLTELLKNSGYKVFYNTYEFQHEDDSNTCGRWACARLLYRDYSLDQFYQMITHYKNKYEFNSLEDTVAYLIYEIIKK
jgi:hypothetical protein